MTKNEIKADLKLVINLIQESKRLLDNIYNNLEGTSSDIDEMFVKIQEGEITEISRIMDYLEENECLANMKVGENISPATVKVGYNSTEISVEHSVRGGVLKAYTSESDSKTYQSGILYSIDGNLFDLVMAEVKAGELAKAHKLPEDNKDIDVYTWVDPSKEDFTDNFTISHEECIAILVQGEYPNAKFTSKDYEEIAKLVDSGKSITEAVENYTFNI